MQIECSQIEVFFDKFWQYLATVLIVDDKSILLSPRYKNVTQITLLVKLMPFYLQVLSLFQIPCASYP